MNILIVDDDAFIIKMLQLHTGEQAGHQTVGVRSGAEAVSLIECQDFDLALLDLNLTDTNGFDLLERIRSVKEASSLPVIVMTAQKDVKTELRAFELGANDFLRKPLNPELLMARVNNLLGFHHAFRTAWRGVNRQMTGPFTGEFSAHVSASMEQVSSLTATIYPAGASGEAMVPCEMPVMLLDGDASFFCKTLKIGPEILMILAFNEIPRRRGFFLELIHPNGETMRLEVLEVERREIARGSPGNLRLLLGVAEGHQLFREFFIQLNSAYQARGLKGLREILGGSVSPGTSAAGAKRPALGLESSQGVRYGYQKELGKGGFATVFLVRDLALQRLVAMKVLSPQLASDPRARENFLGEARLAAQFHHPNIVFVYEVGQYTREEANRLLDFPDKVMASYNEFFIYFTMHYIQGSSVADGLHEGPLPLSSSLEIFTAVLKALSFAHQKGVIHRDIKPSNIMIDSDDNIIVTDFGIACRVKKDGDDESQDAGECSPRYASPEQLTRGALDGRSDIYNLGITLYEMVCGRPPFMENDLRKLVAEHLRAEAILPSHFIADLDPTLEAMIMKCLKKKPGSRYASADEILKELASQQQAIEGESEGQSLRGILEKVLRLDQAGDVLELMEQLQVHLHQHEGKDSAAKLEQRKARIAEAPVLDAILGRGLREEHFEALHQFFSKLAFSNSLSTLLRWFDQQPWAVARAFLARLAVLSATEDLVPLIDHALGLKDSDAVLFLRAFRDENVIGRPGLLERLARHAGLNTSLELLRYMHLQKRISKEAYAVLLLFTRDSPHEQVRSLSARMVTRLHRKSTHQKDEPTALPTSKPGLAKPKKVYVKTKKIVQTELPWLT